MKIAYFAAAIIAGMIICGNTEGQAATGLVGISLVWWGTAQCRKHFKPKPSWWLTAGILLVGFVVVTVGFHIVLRLIASANI